MRERLFVGLVLALTIALLIIGRIFPTNLTWGFDQWGFLPSWLVWLCVTIGLGAVLLAATNRLGLSPGSLSSPAYRLVFGNQFLSAVLWGVVLLVLFLMFRSQAPVYGDGYTVVVNSKQSLSQGLANLHEYLRPLSIYFYRFGHAVLTDVFGIDYRLAFGVVSAIGGVLGTFALWILSGKLSRSEWQRWFVFLAAGASGCTLLWFGYLELYTWPTTALLWLIIAMLARAENRLSTGLALVTLLVASLIHMILLPLGLWMFFLATQSAAKRKSEAWRFSLRVQILLVVLLVSGAAILYDLVSKPFVMIPLLAKATNPYTAFSVPHLADMANLLIFGAPLGLLLLLASLTGHKVAASVGTKLTAAAAVYFLLYAFWTDPLMGVPRDWDLVSLFGFPLSLWGAARFVQSADESQLSWRTALAVGIAALVFVGPAVAAQTSADYSVKRMDRLLWNDPHYQTTYDNAYRCISWGWILTSLVGDNVAALRYYERRVQADSTCALSWQAIGKINADFGRPAEASAAFERAVSLNPEQADHWLTLAGNLRQAGKVREAYTVFAQLAALMPAVAELQTYAGLAAIEMGNYAAAIAHFRHTLTLAPNDPVASGSLGFAFNYANRPDSALHYLNAAFLLVAAQQQPEILRGLVHAHIALGNRREADSVFGRYAALAPKAPDLNQLRAAIDQLKSGR